MSDAERETEGSERRVNLRLREIFIEAYDVIEPFFDNANSWGGHTH
jgi:hypothetical protein